MKISKDNNRGCDMFHFAGCGALNLDHIFVVDSLNEPELSQFNLKPGGEIWGNRNDANKLLEILKSKGKLCYHSGGGSSANTITILASLGWNSAFIGITGDDNEGLSVLESMKDVNCEGVKKQGNTAICIILLDNSRDRAIFVSPHNLEEAFITETSEKIIENSKCIHLSSLVFDRGLKNQIELINYLKNDQLLSFDPGEIYAKKGLSELLPVLSRTNILFITETEINLLLSDNILKNNLLDKLKYLYKFINNNNFYYNINNDFKELNSPVIICKKGAKGSLLYNNIKTIEFPAYKASDIVDNTGAGDAFNAGFLDGLIKGKNLEDCLENATKLAFKSLMDYGRHWIKTKIA